MEMQRLVAAAAAAAAKATTVAAGKSGNSHRHHVCVPSRRDCKKAAVTLEVGSRLRSTALSSLVRASSLRVARVRMTTTSVGHHCHPVTREPRLVRLAVRALRVSQHPPRLSRHPIIVFFSPFSFPFSYRERGRYAPSDTIFLHRDLDLPLDEEQFSFYGLYIPRLSPWGAVILE